jgi:hypothetical protein
VGPPWNLSEFSAGYFVTWMEKWNFLETRIAL